MREELSNSLKLAMKARDAQRISTIRLINATIKDRDIAVRSEDNVKGVSDEEILSILAKMIKQRRDSIAQYDSAGRTELSKIETDEITVINEFLPEALTDDEINNLIEKAISETGAESMKDMGRVMGIIRPQIQGRADAGEISKRVKEALNS